AMWPPAREGRHPARHLTIHLDSVRPELFPHIANTRGGFDVCHDVASSAALEIAALKSVECPARRLWQAHPICEHSHLNVTFHVVGAFTPFMEIISTCQPCPRIRSIISNGRCALSSSFSTCAVSHGHGCAQCSQEGSVPGNS